MSELTSEQRAAISARGKVIVSASAGSGKTLVMIERLVSLIAEGTDVRSVLAVTFTNKAAAQMRDRLRNELLKRISVCGEAERARLKEQLRNLPLADISTLHAWCARLVRSHFYLADVDPAFRIVGADDAEGQLLSARALDEVFDACYEEGGEEFKRLLSAYYRKKKDAKLREYTVSLCRAERGRADYRERLAAIGQEDGFSSVCGDIAARFRRTAERFSRMAAELSERAAEYGGKGVPLLGAIAAAADAVVQAENLFAMTALTLPKLPNAPSATKETGERRKTFKQIASLSAAVKAMYKEFAVYEDEATEHERYLDGQRTARALADLALRYDARLTELKREAGVLDYDDLEHCALKILQNDEARAALREHYRYLFVDEYQDINPTQEQILTLVGGEEVFLVGDAKQSIYGFRGSRSEFFMQKTRDFPVSLALTENFRSSAAVLEAVNRVFSRAMTEETGIVYAREPMRGGRRYGEHGGAVRFHTVPAEETEERERGVYSVRAETLPETDAQAEKIADLIEEEYGSEWFDADEGLVKQIGFGDIAVLVRKNSGDAEKIVAALSERDIPVTTTSSVNVCDYWEARLVIDWLSYLDNPEQDIPYAGALLSRIGGLTDGDLARIRLRFPSAYTFREACRSYAEKMRDDLSGKLRAFAERTEHYRALMRVRTAAEIVDLLLSDGLEAEIAAKRDGEARLRRVRRLTAEGNGSVNDFLRRLKALSYRVQFSESGGDRAVKVVTMHAAKGLEYPVVFLASLDAPFYAERNEVIRTDRYGFAPKSYDFSRKTARETVLRRASFALCDEEEIKGELNLLYVAMTRAKYRLHLLFKGQSEVLSPLFAKRFSEFIDAADCADYFVREEARGVVPPSAKALAYRPDEKLLSALSEVYCRPYAHAESTEFPVKSSATDLMEAAEEEEKVRSAATAEEGLAYHAFLEHVEFGRGAEEELARMKEEGLLTEEQLTLLDGERLRAILALPAIASLAGKRVFREYRFLLSLPAREVPVFCTDAEDEIVFQGALDLLAEDEAGYLILDYKFSGAGEDALRKRYAPQLMLYKKAVSRAMGVREETVRAKIVNIKRCFEVEM